MDYNTLVIVNAKLEMLINKERRCVYSVVKTKTMKGNIILDALRVTFMKDNKPYSYLIDAFSITKD